jgi:hypothetical protein
VSRPGAELLDGVTERTAIGGHDGRSGASLDRARLADGTPVVVKRVRPEDDITMIITNDTVGREYVLWHEGVLDELPPGVRHCILAGWHDDGTTTLIMRDLGDAMLGWNRVLTRSECRRVIDAATAVHDAFRDRPPHPALCRLDDRVAIMRPSFFLGPAAGSDLAAPVIAGWERFADLVPADVAGAVFRLHDDPAPLVSALASRPCSLQHGDLWFVNVALASDAVVLIDWGLASWAPPALEFTMFLVGAMSNVEATREQVIADFRSACGDHYDDVGLSLSYLATLCDFGWNKALDAADHDDPAKRATEAAELEWWVARARETLDAGLLDTGGVR